MSVDELRRFLDLVRRDHGRFRKKWLVFHGTASPALPGVVRAGGIVPWNVLERRNIVTPTGEQYFALEPGSFGRRVVSVTRNPLFAAKYAHQAELLSRMFILDLEQELGYMRKYLADVRRGKGGSDEWKSFHSYLRVIGSRIARTWSKRRASIDDIYPVIFAAATKQPTPAEHYNKYGITAKSEEYLVQIPLHRAYIFVPRDKVNHARRILSKRDPRLAERVFPFEVLEKLYKRELKGERLFK